MSADGNKPPHKLALDEVVVDLTADGLLSREDGRRVLEERGVKNGSILHPLAAIVSKGCKSAKPPHGPLTFEVLTAWLAERAGLPYRRIDPLKVDINAVTTMVSYAYASHHQILALAVTDDAIVVATSEPYLTDWVEELARLLHRRVERVLANPADVNRYIKDFYSLSHLVRRAAADPAHAEIGDITNLGKLVELGRSGKLEADDRLIVTLVDWLLQYAFDQRASDIHLEPKLDQGEIRFRIDGVLQRVYQLPPSVLGAVVGRIKTLGRMDVSERRRPQDGRLKTRTPAGEEVELRLSTMPTAVGEKMVLRIFDPSVLVRSFEQLGFGEEDIRRWEGMVRQPYGAILVTGPTGSGKTTTLYSTLKQLAQPEVNVCTIEDPIEMIVPNFNQTQTQPGIGLDFASGVRALLRQDPDIIMIGEIRDHETAEIAVQAALTGHLVLSSLHTNDAASAVTRLLEIGVPPYLINATLLGVVAQRLVRTLCPHCKQPGLVDADAWQALIRPWQLPLPTSACVARGCPECRHTGYYGRIGLYETLTLTPSLHNLIRPEAEAEAIRAQAIREGMQPLIVSGARKIAAGLTTVDEVAKVLPPEKS